MFAVELNENLPYMPGEVEIERAQIDMVLEPARPHYGLFAPPKEPVSLADYAMALHAATLVKDGGTLQIGIGAFSDALTHALVLRHRTPPSATFSTSLARPFRSGPSSAPSRSGSTAVRRCSLTAFSP